MKKSKWLDRRLIELPCYYRLVLTEKDFKSELKRMKMNHVDYIKNPQSHAVCQFFEGKDGKRIVLVCLREGMKFSAVEIYGLLVHEAVHIFQDWCEHVGENSVGKETQAYAIQSISQELILSYNQQMGIKINN